MVRRIAHIVNPVPVRTDHELFQAQEVTFETMRRAKTAAGRSPLEVTLFATRYEDDHRPMGSFVEAPRLTRSVMDCGDFSVSRKLPLIGDILRGLYASSNADVFVYTNVDIALQQNFYMTIARMIDDGLEACTVTRRTVMASEEQARDLEWLYRQEGEPHIGHDCFVFRRHVLEDVDFHALCIGFPPVGRVLVAALSTRASQFEIRNDLHLTFHLNDIKTWEDPRFNDFWNHNRRSALRTLEGLAARQALSPLAREIAHSIEQQASL